MEQNYQLISLSLFRRVLAFLTLFFYLMVELCLPPSTALAQDKTNFNVRDGKMNNSPASSQLQEIVIPPELGLIEESYKGTSDKTIIYIQDAHVSLDAQENIAKMIEHLVEEEGIETVFEEGYEGPVPTDKYFGFMKDAEVKERVAYFLMDKLRIGGAEYAHINRKHDFKLIGIDRVSLHRENIDWYRRTADLKKDIDKDLKIMTMEIKRLTDRFFPKPVKEWMKLKSRLDRKQLDLFNYLQRTKKFMTEKIDSKAFQETYPKITLLLSAQATNDKLIIEAAQDLDYRDLFQEIGRLEDHFAKVHLATEQNLRLFQYYKAVQLLKRLGNIELSTAEFEEVKGLLTSLNTEDLANFVMQNGQRSIVFSKDWKTNLRKAIKFYETANERDHVIDSELDRFLKSSEEDSAVLVFGGFHKESIKRLFREKSLSYHIITPHIREIDAKHMRYYKNLMSMGHHAFEIPTNVIRASRSEPSFQRWAFMGDLLAFSELRIMYDTGQRAKDMEFVFFDDQMQQRLSQFRRSSPVSFNKPVVPKARSEARSLPPLRVEKDDIFGVERERYLNHVGIDTLPDEIQALAHTFEWPVDMTVSERHISNFYGVTHFQSPDKPDDIHYAIDLQAEPGTPVTALEDGFVVFVKRFDQAGGWDERAHSFADVWVYSPESNLLWLYVHLDLKSVPERILKHHWFDGYEDDPAFKVNKGDTIGTINQWHTEKALADNVDVPPSVEKKYGRTHNHLHLEVRLVTDLYNGWGVDHLKPVNPLQLLRPLYELPKGTGTARSEAREVTATEEDIDVLQALENLNTPSIVYLDYRDFSERFSRAQREELFLIADQYPEKVRLVIYNADVMADLLKPFRELRERNRNVWITQVGADQSYLNTQRDFVKDFDLKANIHLSRNHERLKEQYGDAVDEIYFFRYQADDDQHGLLAASLLWADYNDAGRSLDGIGRDAEGYLTIVSETLRNLIQRSEARRIVAMAA